MKRISASFSQLLPVLFIALAALPCGCSKQATPGVLAKVGSTEIRVEDFQREAAWRQQQRRPATDKQALLDELILQEALLQRAKDGGVASDPLLQRQIRNLIVGTLLEREVEARQKSVSVTPEEVKAEYERKIGQYTRKAKARFALLFLEADGKMSEARRAEQKGRLQEARRIASTSLVPGGRGPAAQGFGAVALDCSDDQASRYRGGDIGWVDVGTAQSRWPQQLLEVGYALEKGQMSEVIEAEGGFYVILKTDWREQSITALAQVEATLQQSLLVSKRREMEQGFRREAVQQASVKIDPKALAAVDLPAPSSQLAHSRDAQPPSVLGVTTASAER